jgi:hypothetical protein
VANGWQASCRSISEPKCGIRFILESSKRDAAAWNTPSREHLPMLFNNGQVRNAPQSPHRQEASSNRPGYLAKR